MPQIEFVSTLDDTDLRALCYLVGQAETYSSGALPPHAERLSRTIQAEQTRREKARRVALSNPQTGRTLVTLQAGPL